MDFGSPRFEDSPHEFAQYLRDLKGRGCNLLVTGDVPDAVAARATRTLFGRGRRRFRVLALLDTTGRIRDSLPESDDRLWIVERANETGRDSASTSHDGSMEMDDDLDTLRRAIGTVVDSHESTFGELDPAELRVGVDLSLEDDSVKIARFLRRTTQLVTEFRGMGHYHLPTADDDPLVETLSPLFDARIELRRMPGRPPEQRWHVPKFDKTTIWVRL